MSFTSTALDELAVSAELRAAMAELAHLKDEKIRRGLRFRQAIRQAAHRQLVADGFGEFETPILGPWINEYAVGSISATTPSGEQLWLAQSPQVYKQMLIAGGYQRYYQFAHCFREEEREPGRTDYLREFIQLDIEMETADLDVIIAMAERLIVGICTAVGLDCPVPPFPRIEAREAERRYGTDKPDLRMRPDEMAVLWVMNFPLAIRDDSGGIALTRHPMALPRQVPGTAEEMLDIDTFSFDLVLNGFELASGGLRINEAALQRRVLDLAGIDPTSFVDLLHVLEDCPPHGGLGLGLDRLCMQLMGADSLATVTGFPARFGY